MSHSQRGVAEDTCLLRHKACWQAYLYTSQHDVISCTTCIIKPPTYFFTVCFKLINSGFRHSCFFADVLLGSSLKFSLFHVLQSLLSTQLHFTFKRSWIKISPLRYLPCLTFLLAFLNPSINIPRKFLKLENNWFHSHSFKFTIH